MQWMPEGIAALRGCSCAKCVCEGEVDQKMDGSIIVEVSQKHFVSSISPASGEK